MIVEWPSISAIAFGWTPWAMSIAAQVCRLLIDHEFVAALGEATLAVLTSRDSTPDSELDAVLALLYGHAGRPSGGPRVPPSAGDGSEVEPLGVVDEVQGRTSGARLPFHVKADASGGSHEEVLE